VLATRTGFAGGTSARPEYAHPGDHRESVEVVYDPARISYAALLDVFWRSHPATLGGGPLRTREAVLFVDGSQRRAAIVSRRALARRAGEPVVTEVLPVGRFWPAPAAHQKANLRRLAPTLVQALARRYGSEEAFLASTAAARLDGWAAGFGGEAALREASAALGVPVPALLAALREGGDPADFCPRPRA